VSEYVDHFALLTEAESLSDLRGQVASVLDEAVVVAFPIDPETGTSVVAKDNHSAAEQHWAAGAAPRWVVVAAPDLKSYGPMAHLNALAKLGPAVHMFTPEDGPAPEHPVRWRMHSIVDGASWSVMVADVPWGDRWHNPSDAVLMAAGTTGIGSGRDALAKAIGVAPDAIQDTLTLDGGQAFKALAGIDDIYLFDQYLFGPTLMEGVQYMYEIGDH
jgi:hypothetical protein